VRPRPFALFNADMSLPPTPRDTKDWTWTLERRCPDCGLDASEVVHEELGMLIRDNADRWQPVLADPDAAQRPRDDVWSPLEYACHVRDVHLVFAERVTRMLAEDDPLFANWDQDQAAVDADYAGQDPAVVARELADAAGTVAGLYDDVAGAAWLRRGRRDNGSEFTVESIGRYHLHDVHHHLWDVRG